MADQKLSLAVKNWLEKTNISIDYWNFKVNNKWNWLRLKWTVTIHRPWKRSGNIKVNYRWSVKDLKEKKPFDIYSFLYCISSDADTFQQYADNPWDFSDDFGYKGREWYEVYKQLEESYEKFMSINIENELKELYQIFLDNNY